MALIRLVLAALAVLAATADAAILDGCDDCFSPVTDLVYGDVYLDGSQYGAFSVCSNGYIAFAPTASSTITGYSYNPTPISQTEGSPMVAGFWADINLQCSGSTNRVVYSETCDTAVLNAARAATGDSSFNPGGAVVAKYEAVQRFSCPVSCDTNTFEIIVATDRSLCRSYAIFNYQSMGWSRSTSSNANAPTVGATNGRCQGPQLSYPSGYTPAAYLQLCQTIVYRIDLQSNFGQVNRGNMALVQNKAKAMNDGGKAVAMYGPDTGAVMQNFPEKNAETLAMEDKLTLALQSIH